MMLDAVGCCWVLLGAVGCCRVLLGAAGCFWMLLDAFGCFPILSDTFRYFPILSDTFRYFPIHFILLLFQPPPLLGTTFGNVQVANEVARSHLRHPLGDLYPMGCAIPTMSHVDDLRSTDDTGPCHLMVMWGQALLATATSWVTSTRRFDQFKTNVLMSLVRVFLDGICLMSDELWVARSFVKPVVQLMATRR